MEFVFAQCPPKAKANGQVIVHVGFSKRLRVDAPQRGVYEHMRRLPSQVDGSCWVLKKGGDGISEHFPDNQCQFEEGGNNIESSGTVPEHDDSITIINKEDYYHV